MAQQQITAKKQQELQLQYTTYKNNLQQLAQKIGDVEQETEEHKYDKPHPIQILDTLDPLPLDRKCFRMVNGVLVERTVKDVIPALKINSDGLKKVLDELVKQYKKQQDDMEKWKCSNAETNYEALADYNRTARPGINFEFAVNYANFHVVMWKRYEDPISCKHARLLKLLESERLLASESAHERASAAAKEAAKPWGRSFDAEPMSSLMRVCARVEA
ncbi:hypothetical protein MMC27_006758 [Xylographa pallens]|nr:hypothetical protein [Xylographa pallens]